MYKSLELEKLLKDFCGQRELSTFYPQNLAEPISFEREKMNELPKNPLGMENMRIRVTWFKLGIVY